MEMNKEFFKTHVAFHGSDTETTVAMEECGELIQAISKCKRYGCRDAYRDSLVEEIGDVLFILEELKIIYGIKDEEVQENINGKIKRQALRMKNDPHIMTCSWCQDEFCTNHDSPYVADFCPITEYPYTCRYAEK